MTACKYRLPKIVATFEAWLADPEREPVRALAARCPPWHCYREIKRASVHYTIHAYRNDGTLSLLHGADSSLPGLVAYGISPDELQICDCGEWAMPTSEQLGHMQRHFEALEAARACAPAKARTRKHGAPVPVAPVAIDSDKDKGKGT